MTAEGLLSQLVLRIAGGLLHFVWQGAALALLAAVCLAFLERRTASTRYAVAVGFLAAMLAAPLLTVFFFDSADAILTRTLLLLGQPSVARLKTQQWAFWIATLWLGGVTTGWIRLAVGWRLSLRMIREAGIPDAATLALFERVVQQTRSGAVRLLVSARAVSPVVIGWLRPVVLLPVTVLTGLSAEELRVVIAHELAHVRRHDYLVNMLQRVVESLLFYHPGVWWLSARVRTEREHAADDAALGICDDPVVLARALVRLEETRSDRITAVAATGGNVANRVARILQREPDRPGWQPLMATLTFMGLWAAAGLWPFAAAPSETLRPLSSSTSTPIQASTVAALAPVETALTTGLTALAALAPAAPAEVPPPEAPQAAAAAPIVVKGKADVRRLSGQVRDTRGPLSVARIWIIAKPEVRTIPNVSSYIDETDNQGRYELNVPPGRYVISIEDRNRIYRPRTVEAPQRRIVVPAEQASMGLDLDFTTFALNDPLRVGTTVRPDEVRGRIEFDDGNELPVGTLPYFQVILTSGGARFTTQPFTNTQGLFTIPVEPGEYDVRVAPLWLGYYLKSMTYGNVDLTKNRLTVKRGEGDTEVRVVLTKARPEAISPGVKVSGRITGWKAGSPGLALLTVVVPGEIFQVANIIPESDGSFEVNGVPPGQYTIGSGFARSTLVEVGRTDVTNVVVVTDTPDTPRGFPVPYTGSGSYVTGVVEGLNGAVPQFEVRLTAAHAGASPVPSHVVTVSDPEFSVILPEGTYRVSVAGLPQGYSLKSVFAGPMDLTEPFLITYRGVSDRFSGAPIASPKGIVISLNAP